MCRSKLPHEEGKYIFYYLGRVIVKGYAIYTRWGALLMATLIPKYYVTRTVCKVYHALYQTEPQECSLST